MGFRLATWHPEPGAWHPERVAAVISQNGNAYAEGLSDGWKPIRAYWEDSSQTNRDALRAFLAPETTVWQYTHGVPDTTTVSPDGYSLDNFYLSRPGADAVYYATRLRGASNKKAKRALHFRPRPLEWLSST